MKIETKIGVIGCGNVGLITMRVLAHHGYQTLGWDTEQSARDAISSFLGGGSVAEKIDDLSECDVIFACVPTDPIDETGAADLSILTAVVKEVARLEESANYRCRLFVQRSTCPPGTARSLATLLRRTNYAVNPSFLRKKTAWADSINPERIAIAGNDAAVELLRTLFGWSSASMFISSVFEAAELLKYVENATDAVLISLWNEFLSISDSLCLPRSEFLNIFSTFTERDKFATAVRVPGQAFGLWCLPKDLSSLCCQFENLRLGVLLGALKTNELVLRQFGENQTPGSALFEFLEGRIKLTEEGREFILKVRQ